MNELTSLYLNILLSCFSSDFNYFVVDERDGLRPAGIGRFAKSKGGTLHDDLRDGKFMTVGYLESWIFELASVKLGAGGQNLGLMSQAFGIGGFPHFAGHPFGWTQTPALWTLYGSLWPVTHHAGLSSASPGSGFSPTLLSP